MLRVDGHPLRTVLVLPQSVAQRRGEALLFGGDDDHIGRDFIRLVVVEDLFARDRDGSDHPIFARLRIALHEPPADIGIFQ